MSPNLVIVGGGLAAQRCVEALRRLGHDGPITLVCDEPRGPYDRPPLSKEVLAGTRGERDIELRPAAWYDDHRIELRLAQAAIGLDASAREVLLADGSALPYDRLLIATGAAPRRLGLFDGAPNAHVLRCAADAARLREALVPGSRLIVVGAGFIGQEVAATARGLGVAVTLLEAMDAPLAGLLGHELGGWFADLHRRHGVDVRCGVTAVEAVREPSGRVTAVRTGDGRVLGCDTVLVGVGVAPADEWLEGSGLGGGGVECDAEGRTALPGVYAAGDVCRAYDPLVGAHVRSEHWEPAARQGAAAARAMLGLAPGRASLASFWSDQYGIRIQYVGHAGFGDEPVVEGDRDAADFSAVWKDEVGPVAALLVGRPQALPLVRSSITQTFDHPRTRTPA